MALDAGVPTLPIVPAAAAPFLEAAQHCCKCASMEGGADFSVALIVRRGTGAPLVVYATGVTPQCDTRTRKLLKSAAAAFFSSLPSTDAINAPTSRNPVTGLRWAPAAASYSPSGSQPGGGAGAVPSSSVSDGRADGDSSAQGADGSGLGQSCGGVGGTPGGTPALGGAGALAVAGTQAGSIPASSAATSRYGPLPQLPLTIGSAAATGKRDRAGNALPSAPTREFSVTADMARSYLAKFESAGLSLTRLHMTGFLNLLRFFYDERLKRVGNNTPYEPLFPQIAQGVSVLFKYIEPGDGVTVPLVLKNTSHQHKNETTCLLIFMMYGTEDEAYEWVLARYCEGMRVPATGARPRTTKSKPKGLPVVGAGGGAGGAGGGGGNGRGGGALGGNGAHGSGGNGGEGNVLRRALYYPSPTPPLPAISTSLFMGGQLVGSGDIHPEFYLHHGHPLPPRHVALFLLSCTAEGAGRRYAFDDHPSFCVEGGHPQTSTLTQCLRQRVMWPVADIGYVVDCPFRSVFAMACLFLVSFAPQRRLRIHVSDPLPLSVGPPCLPTASWLYPKRAAPVSLYGVAYQVPRRKWWGRAWYHASYPGGMGWMMQPGMVLRVWLLLLRFLLSRFCTRA